MTDIVLEHENTESNLIALPQPRHAIDIRQAKLGDLPFVDDLQKKHSKMVGFFPKPWFEKNITDGKVLIAETVNEPRPSGSGAGENDSSVNEVRAHNPLPHPRNGRGSSHPLGYCIAHDRYFKRDDVGVVYQLNVTPGRQRGLIGASLIKAVFERAAYGCKLFCCWCAQDLDANHFWESIGFVPLAFRTGSRGTPGRKNAEPRIHIFWQKRIREGDCETPYWFPSQTHGGAVRENRLVLPIPPGTHWSDAKPAVLPGMEKMEAERQALLESDAEKSKRPRQRAPRKKKVVQKPNAIANGGLRFGPPPEAKPEKPKKAKRAPLKHDPKYVAAARELKDRYLDEVNSGRMLPSADGKYDVSRQLEAAPTVFNAGGSAETVEEMRLLDAA